MSEKKKVVAGLTLNQVLLIGGVLTGGGSGAYWGVPFFQKQLDRIDVVIYLMCDSDQSCVDLAWDHILKLKARRKALSGGGR